MATWVIYDLTPLPHTDFGGAVLACSASGKTPEVLGVMEKARTRNENITIVGLASAEAHEFRNLCDHFVGIYIDERIPNPLRFLASTGEYAISQLLDCLVVLGAERAELREEDLKHENLGPTGPYERRDLMTEDLGSSGPYYSSDEHDSK